MAMNAGNPRPPTATSREAEPAAVTALFLEVDRVRRYEQYLATTGVDHGLIGPREVPRLWSRHVLNCAAVAEVVPEGASVIDIGSGAGLPGIPLALVRPDLHITLLEPLERRCRWLTAVVDDLELGERVTVRRDRAEEVYGQLRADVVTSRAVAALPKLLTWSLPLVAAGGSVVAMKGERAAEELAGVEAVLKRLGLSSEVALCGRGVLAEPVRIVRVVVREAISPTKARQLTRTAHGATRHPRTRRGS